MAVPPSSGQAMCSLQLCLEAGRGWCKEQGLGRSYWRFKSGKGGIDEQCHNPMNQREKSLPETPLTRQGCDYNYAKIERQRTTTIYW